MYVHIHVYIYIHILLKIVPFSHTPSLPLWSSQSIYLSVSLALSGSSSHPLELNCNFRHLKLQIPGYRQILELAHTPLPTHQDLQVRLWVI